jgi:hypothetical protein
MCGVSRISVKRSRGNSPGFHKSDRQSLFDLDMEDRPHEAGIVSPLTLTVRG